MARKKATVETATAEKAETVTAETAAAEKAETVTAENAAAETAETAETVEAVDAEKAEKAETAEIKDKPAKKSKAEKPQTKTAARLMYMGASVKGMKTGTVITGEIPDYLDVAFVKELFIDPDEAGEFLKRKAVTASREAFCYRKSAELANELRIEN